MSSFKRKFDELVGSQHTDQSVRDLLSEVESVSSACRWHSECISQLSTAVDLVSRPGPLCQHHHNNDRLGSLFSWRVHALCCSSPRSDRTQITCCLFNNTSTRLLPDFWQLHVQYGERGESSSSSSCRPLPHVWRGDGHQVNIEVTAGSLTSHDLAVSCSLVFCIDLTRVTDSASTRRPVVCVPLFDTVIDLLTVAEVIDPDMSSSSSLSLSPAASLSVLVKLADSSSQSVSRAVWRQLLSPSQQQHQQQQQQHDIVRLQACGQCACMRVCPVTGTNGVRVSVSGDGGVMVARWWRAVWWRLHHHHHTPPQQQRVAASLVARLTAISNKVEQKETATNDDNDEELMELWSALERGVCQHLPVYITL